MTFMKIKLKLILYPYNCVLEEYFSCLGDAEVCDCSLDLMTRGLVFYSRIRSNVCKICKIKYGVDVFYGRIYMYLPKIVYTSMRNIYLFQLYYSCLPLIQATLSLGLDDFVCKIINNFWTPIINCFLF